MWTEYFWINEIPLENLEALVPAHTTWKWKNMKRKNKINRKKNKLACGSKLAEMNNKQHQNIDEPNWPRTQTQNEEFFFEETQKTHQQKK